LPQLAESFLHLADRTRRAVEPLADGRLAPLHDLEAFPQTLVQLPGELRELLADELALSGERLGNLRAKRVELLLDEEEPATGVRTAAAPPDLPDEHHDRHGDPEGHRDRPAIMPDHPAPPLSAPAIPGRSRTPRAVRASGCARCGSHAPVATQRA